jgi:hypothetical protein
MNQTQLDWLSRKPKIKISELEDCSDRTLLYGRIKKETAGYAGEHNLSFHLYIKQEMFHFTAYETNTRVPLGVVFKSFKYRDEITPDMIITSGINMKYIQHFYPECCDYEFCTLLKSKGIILDFKNLDKDRPTKIYYGILYEDMITKSNTI